MKQETGHRAYCGQCCGDGKGLCIIRENSGADYGDSNCCGCIPNACCLEEILNFAFFCLGTLIPPLAPFCLAPYEKAELTRCAALPMCFGGNGDVPIDTPAVDVVHVADFEKACCKTALCLGPIGSCSLGCLCKLNSWNVCTGGGCTPRYLKSGTGECSVCYSFRTARVCKLCSDCSCRKQYLYNSSGSSTCCDCAKDAGGTDNTCSFPYCLCWEDRSVSKWCWGLCTCGGSSACGLCKTRSEASDKTAWETLCGCVMSGACCVDCRANCFGKPNVMVPSILSVLGVTCYPTLHFDCTKTDDERRVALKLKTRGAGNDGTAVGISKA